MEDWISLDLISIEKALTIYPDFDIREFALSVLRGDTPLYVFIPFGDVVDNISGRNNSIKITISYSRPEDEEIEDISLFIWSDSHVSQPGPCALKLSKKSSSLIAEHVLSNLINESDRQSLETPARKEHLFFLDKNGNETFILGRNPEYPDGSLVDQLDIEDAIMRLGKEEYLGCLYRERASGVIPFSEFLAPSSFFEGNSTCPLRTKTSSNSKVAGFGAQMAPHWGEGLRRLISLSNRLWGEHIVDRNDETTFPINADVIREIESLGYNNRVAKDLAVAIRPDWGKAVVRKKEKHE